MSFSVRRDHDIAEEIRRIVRERLDRALESLDRNDGPAAADVHDARKRFKEVRAMLRLVREPLGKVHAAENHFYRDAGRALSTARDASAMVEAWDELAKASPAEMDTTALHRVRGRLRKRAATPAGEGDDLSATARELVGELSAARERIDAWPLAGDRFRLIRPGLRATYAQGRDRLAEVRAGGGDDVWHEWRKRVKDHWYHVGALQPLWKQGLGARKRALKTLSRLIGDDHDLAMLRQLMTEQPRLFGAARNLDLVEELIATRRRSLQHDAIALGGRLYAEPAPEFERRIRAYWRVWRRLDTADAPEAAA